MPSRFMPCSLPALGSSSMSPSIAQQIGKVSANVEVATRKSEFLKIAGMLLRHKTPFNASKSAEAERVTERVGRVLKTAVTAGTLTDWGIDYNNIVVAFSESLRSQSVFDAVLADGMVRAPLRSR